MSATCMPLAGITTWIFDLDNTLYPRSAGIVRQQGMRMRKFLLGRLSLADEEEAARVQRKYFLSHGSTLAGVVRNHDIPAEAYLEYVEDVDITAIQPAPELAAPLGRLPGRRIIFTNASTAHAERVLARLGIRDLIDGISSIMDSNLVAKPGEEAYERLVERHGIDPESAAFFEDLPRNLVPAARLGMRTVWLRNELPDELMGGASEEDFDHAIDDLAEFLAGIVEAQGVHKEAGRPQGKGERE